MDSREKPGNPGINSGDTKSVVPTALGYVVTFPKFKTLEKLSSSPQYTTNFPSRPRFMPKADKCNADAMIIMQPSIRETGGYNTPSASGTTHLVTPEFIPGNFATRMP